MFQKSKSSNTQLKINLVLDSLKFSSGENNLFLRDCVKNLLLKFENDKTAELSFYNFENLQAFYSAQIAFDNLFGQLKQINLKQALIHPFLPEEIVSKIQKYTKITSLDIAKDTLLWESEELVNFIQENPKIDIVVFYAFTGLYAEITQALEKIHKLSQRKILTMIVIDNPIVNRELTDLLKNGKYTHCIWNFGQNPVDLTMSEILEKDNNPFIDEDCYVSWTNSLDGKIKALKLPQNPISDERRIFLEAYLYLLLEHYSKQARLKSLWYRQIIKRFFSHHKFKTVSQAKEVLQDAYSYLSLESIPDFFFSFLPKPSELVYSGESLNPIEIYDLLITKLQQVPDGTLEIPMLFTERTYYEYFFYTTDPDYWQDFFERKDFFVSKFIPNQQFIEFNNLNNTRFVVDYGIKLSL